MSLSKPKISIGSLGGTISMTKKSQGQGVAPSLNAEDFIAAIPGIEKLACLHAQGLFQLPSGHLKFEMIMDALNWAFKQVDEGASGVILTQGTDTLEESAFLCDLLWDRAEPLILMGAMRTPESIGAEGVRNLYNSIICAISPNSKNRGVMVVMNDTIHAARWVRKSHSLLVNTFESDGKTYGLIAEGRVEYFYPPLYRKTFDLPKRLDKKVFLYEEVLSGGVEIIDWVEKTQDGLVIAGFGAGHVSAEMAYKIGELNKKIPVVVCTRTTDGPSVYQTYGYIGAEIDLMARGICMGGYLSERKARILLWVILNNHLDMQAFKDYLQTLVC
ncbi:asparaginase [Helicobacter sp. 11S03491-1]|uniref:asparaginase n=1 Tax=Helicobacter sp. 11S03491-1 TaxID=1476196 RepID=UPI000BA59167|nr:asparaginase [Helicobacter sp. 11S03491-1]PAF43891.1 hypothetical protein BKH45_01110 [Helicobacter sp. 11S03491-1]